MIATLDTPKTPRQRARAAESTGERRMLFGPATWKQYKTLQRYFEQWGGARVSYLDGTIQIMPISLEHEARKSQVGRLLEAYLIEEDREFFFHGSTTLEAEIKRAGKEPDESYCFGTQKEFPDLVIEIAITRGGIDTLELYRRWKIPEVWVRHGGELEAFHFGSEGYVAADESRHFPKLDLPLLASCARVEPFLQAREKFLAGLKKKRRN